MDNLTRAGYLAHYRSDGCQSRIASAREIVRAHPGYALSVSWGKDSVAALILAASVWPTLTVLNARYPNPAERFADMDRVRDLALAMPALSKVTYVEVTCPGEWCMYERAGRAFAEPEAPEEREAARWWKQGFTSAMRAAQERAECVGVMLGLRQDESRARRMNVVTRGTSYTKRDGLNVALPMARMRGSDVWAVLVRAGAPWLRIYDIAPDRETARSGFVWSTGAIGAVARHGGVALWRRAYPVELAAWFDRWPELKDRSYA